MAPTEFSPSAIKRALHGRFPEHHPRLARMLLEQIDELRTHIAQVTGLLDEAIAALPVITTVAHNGTVIDASADGVASAA